MNSPFSTRPKLDRRLMRLFRHLALAGGGFLATWLVVLWSRASGDDNIMGMGSNLNVALGLGTAYTSMAFLTASLMIGPLYLIRSKTPPLSSYLRRDIGIWAAIFAVIHCIASLLIEIQGMIAWKFFFLTPDPNAAFPVLLDFFGFANHFGLIAGLILVLLLAISSNRALKMLKPERWKFYQRWIYTAAILTVIHGIMYQFMALRSLEFVLLFAVLTLVAAVFQIWGIILKRRAGP